MDFNDLSFFSTMKVPTWIKISKNIIPVSLNDVRDLNPYKPDYSKYTLYAFPEKVITQEFSKILAKANFEIGHKQIFYRPGNTKNMDAFIHTDGYNIYPDLAKINYIVSPPGNLMKWWRPKIKISEKNQFKTEIGSNYLRFDEHECELIDQTDLVGLYVVNAGIPHSVTMTQADIANPRICISITVKNKTTGKMEFKCQEVAEKLENSIKELGY
jgi:hypothetical protein